MHLVEPVQKIRCDCPGPWIAINIDVPTLLITSCVICKILSLRCHCCQAVEHALFVDQLAKVAFLLIQVAYHILKDKVEGVRDIRLYRLVGPIPTQCWTLRLNGRDVPSHHR
jgi:hypothetical protein